jgi:hypothetical protein
MRAMVVGCTVVFFSTVRKIYPLFWTLELQAHLAKLGLQHKEQIYNIK